MDQQHRDNRDRRYGGGGRGSQGDASRGSRRRRDRRSRWADGGLDSFRSAAVLLLQLLQIGLQIRHYLAQFDHDQVGGAAMIMYHYDVHVTPAGAAPEVSQPAADLSAVKAELFRLYAEYCFFPAVPVVVYDGQRSLLTPGLLPEGDFQVAVQGRVFNVTVKLVRQQQLALSTVGAREVISFHHIK